MRIVQISDLHYGAVATIRGSVISGLGANIVAFQVTPRYKQHGFSKICAK